MHVCMYTYKYADKAGYMCLIPDSNRFGISYVSVAYRNNLNRGHRAVFTVLSCSLKAKLSALLVQRCLRALPVALRGIEWQHTVTVHTVAITYTYTLYVRVYAIIRTSLMMLRLNNTNSCIVLVDNHTYTCTNHV